MHQSQLGEERRRRAVTHHGVGGQRHPGPVGEVEEDVGGFGEQLTAEREDRASVKVTAASPADQQHSLVLLQVQHEEAASHLQRPLQPVGVSVLENTRRTESTERCRTLLPHSLQDSALIFDSSGLTFYFFGVSADEKITI